MAAASDADLLEYAAGASRIVISHDENTMIGAAIARIRAAQPMPGLLIAPQGKPIGRVIDDLLLIWAASEADESNNLIRFIPL